ncbi:MAG: prepilin peptidase [Actinobacteria bacterium]|nr:prepilin peptidase [Actinomycetota bacterium]
MTGMLAGGGAVLGLVIGSFLNVVVYRVPLGKSIVSPPSACPTCQSPIRPRDNIPVLSWLILWGRCRGCRNPISARYPLVEAGTAAAFAGVALLVGGSWALPAYWVATATAIALGLVDLDHQRIPNAILFPGLVACWALLIPGSLMDGDPWSLARAAGGAGAYFGLLMMVALAARGGFGFGDVKLALLLGTVLAHRSLEVLAVGVFAGFVIGGILGGALLAPRRAGRKDAMPFGPAMVLGAAAAMVWGTALADWYLGR